MSQKQSFKLMNEQKKMANEKSRLDSFPQVKLVAKKMNL